MKSNKIFYIKNLVFNLPDDFDGNVTDALEEVVKYRRSDIAISRRVKGDPGYPKPVDEMDVDDVWDYLWDNENSKLSMQVGMSFYNYEKNVWDDKLNGNRTD